MIIKPRTKPLSLLKLEALLRRLPQTHPKRPKIEEDFAKRLAGYRGEQSLDFFLNLLPDQDIHIIHDLRLPYKNHHFQMDTLLVTSSFISILEVKNFNGTLIFDQAFSQMIRILDDKEEAYPDPIQQAKSHRIKLQGLLERFNIPPLPIIPLVVITNSYSLLKPSQSASKLPSMVIRSSLLPEKIEDIKLKYKEDILSKNEIKKLSKGLIKLNTPLDQDILEVYHLSEQDLLSGVHCPSCFALQIMKKRGKWVCPVCATESQDAHIFSLYDYSLLIGPTITNQKARKFLNLASDSTTKKLVRSLPSPYSGIKKGREYYLSFEKYMSNP